MPILAAFATAWPVELVHVVLVSAALDAVQPLDSDEGLLVRSATSSFVRIAAGSTAIRSGITAAIPNDMMFGTAINGTKTVKIVIRRFCARMKSDAPSSAYLKSGKKRRSSLRSGGVNWLVR